MGKLDTYQVLARINEAKDVRALKKEELLLLCQEIRDYLIDTVSKNSGHFASNLGVVELTVALHYVFNTPEDKIVWDVGHQSYPHKILTGQKEKLDTIRKKDGLHSFIWRNETVYDLLSTGHASTSIGSALGLAVAQKLFNTNNQVVAVIGDGAISGGMAFEALNHAGSLEGLNLLVILNDNEMSISQNVGSLAKGLSHLMSTPHYVKFVEGGKKVLENLPAIRDFALRAQEHFKGMIMPGTLFEEFGFNYIGPVDGHDIKSLVSILKNLKETGGLQFLHIVTKKGKGYAKAEEDPVCYHGVPVFDKEKGIENNKNKVDKSFSATFGKWLCDIAAVDETIIGITPAMRVGSCMDEFATKYKDRFFDVAIAEQHALVFASGLAAGGLRPIVGIYSSFLQRAYDSVIHDIAIQDLPIVLAIDRAGIVGPDGPTHQGVFDIAYLKTVPNIMIFAPSTLKELYLLLNTAYNCNHPVAVRYPRDTGLEYEALDSLSITDTLEVGKGLIVNQGKKVAILAFGSLLHAIEKQAIEHGFTLCNMLFVKPLDEELVCNMAQSHDYVVTIEEGSILGGIGEQIAAIIAAKCYNTKVLNLGVPDAFVPQGTRQEALDSANLSDAKILEAILNFVE